MIDENLTVDSAREAIVNGVCYNFRKPLTHYDIASLCLHIHRVTGKFPQPFNRSTDGEERNDNQSNLKRKASDTDPENIKKRKNKVAEDSGSSVATNKDDGCNSKKSRMTWTPRLQQKFLEAIEKAGKEGNDTTSILYFSIVITQILFNIYNMATYFSGKLQLIRRSF